jgi:hypothetical protein
LGPSPPSSISRVKAPLSSSSRESVSSQIEKPAGQARSMPDVARKLGSARTPSAGGGPI